MEFSIWIKLQDIVTTIIVVSMKIVAIASNDVLSSYLCVKFQYVCLLFIIYMFVNAYRKLYLKLLAFLN